MKPDETKQSISPLAIMAFGLVVIAIVTFAMVRGKNNVQTKQQAPVQETQTQTPAEPIIPDPTAPIASIQEGTQNKEEFRVPAFHQNVDGLTLPPVKDPASVAPAAQAAYKVVQKKPKLIAQLPCFCYCERWGHGSLHDCFVTEHAVTCDICMKEALQADEMDRQGVPIAEIRETIVGQFKQKADDHSGHDH